LALLLTIKIVIAIITYTKIIRRNAFMRVGLLV